MTVLNERQKTPKVVVTFASLTDALAVEDSAKEHGFPGRIIPVPSEIDAGCGFAWAAPAAQRGEVERALADHALAHEGVHEIEMY